jgi:hypothetical protein
VLLASPDEARRGQVESVNEESEDPSGWMRLAAQLALMPELASRLIAEHRDDGRGRCIRCTLPGRGTPGERWPCGPAALAMTAQEVAARAWRQTHFTHPAPTSHKARPV